MARFASKIVGTAMIIALAACSESPTEVIAGGQASNNAIPVAGAGFFAFTANNDGAEFWDQASGDGTFCNVGFYITGPFGPCDNSLVDPPANDVTFGPAQMYGKGPAGADPAPFTFAAGTYEITFLDGIRAYGTEPVGWFTKSAAVYTFNPIDPAISSQINGTVTFTSAVPWGFWIAPVEPILGGDACSAIAMCTDDTKVQQFALFRKADDSKFLVGIEDMPGVEIPPALPPTTAGQFPTGGGDKDFNDFFLNVRRTDETTETLDGRMTGGGNSDAGGGISVSLTIHCDNKLSNNIQIGFGDKQKFHVDKNSLTNVICQFVNDPTPPAAPINIFSGDATGTLNNVAGATLTFKFTDNGEPNAADFISLTVRAPGGAVVLNVVDVRLDNGNIQAHFDQPHKKN